MTRQSRFRSAPKDLCDITYIVGVCQGSIAPNPCAYTRITGALKPAIALDEMETADACRNIGYAQGWECELGGRVEVPTPPSGMPRKYLAAFVGGVLDGAEAARLYPLPGNEHLQGKAGHRAEPQWAAITDPFGDIHPGIDPADNDIEDTDPETPSHD
ncbi:hypothetical protein [Dongia sp.]|uniref:hypothetical protein n=1 Tax=Dongia sp. TaxID=1977262 RepID=UPI0035B36062